MRKRDIGIIAVLGVIAAAIVIGIIIMVNSMPDIDVDVKVDDTKNTTEIPEETTMTTTTTAETTTTPEDTTVTEEITTTTEETTTTPEETTTVPTETTTEATTTTAATTTAAPPVTTTPAPVTTTAATTTTTTTAATTKVVQTAPPDAEWSIDGKYYKYKDGDSADTNPVSIFVWVPEYSYWQSTGNPNWKVDPAHTVEGDLSFG